MSLLFHNVTFRYDLSGQPLFRQFNADFHAGWSGVVGANGSGKTTLLHLAAGLLEPSEGRIIRPARIALCEQRTDAPPDSFEEFLRSQDPEALRLRASLVIGRDWKDRWTTLSHGERKRAQIAALNSSAVTPSRSASGKESERATTMVGAGPLEVA